MLSPLTITSLDQGPMWTPAWDDRRDPEPVPNPDLHEAEVHPRPSPVSWFIRYGWGKWPAAKANAERG
jgi:hypothetical protein